jgi:hypothetical protein
MNNLYIQSLEDVNGIKTKISDDEDEPCVTSKLIETKLILNSNIDVDKSPLIAGGSIQCKVLDENLPGFEQNSSGTLALSFFVANGVQNSSHPSPGSKYNGTCKTIFLPYNDFGSRLSGITTELFEQGKLFKLTKSKLNEYIVTFNDIEFKTSKKGGPEWYYKIFCLNNILFL